MHTRIAHPSCLPEILAMQQKYHRSQIGINPEKGFLTYQCSLETLKRLNDELGIIVSIDRGLVIGYNLLMTAERARDETFYSDLIKAYEHLRPTANMAKVAVSAQYCVEKGHRGGSVIKALYTRQRRVLAHQGPTTSIGEIDSENKISISSATNLLKYAVIGDYENAGTKWIVFERDESI